MNPDAPSLYGLLKLHKENKCIRTVVSYDGTPNVKLSRHSAIKFKELTNFKPKYGIKNRGGTYRVYERF